MDCRKSSRIREEIRSQSGRVVRKTARDLKPEVKLFLESARGRRSVGPRKPSVQKRGRGRPRKYPIIQLRGMGTLPKRSSVCTESATTDTISVIEDTNSGRNRKVFNKYGIPVVTVPNCDEPPELLRQTMDIDERSSIAPYSHISPSFDSSGEDIRFVESIDSIAPIIGNENRDQPSSGDSLSNVKQVIKEIKAKGLERGDHLITVLVHAIVRSNLGDVNRSVESIISASDNWSDFMNLWKEPEPTDEPLIVPVASSSKYNWNGFNYNPGGYK